MDEVRCECGMCKKRGYYLVRICANCGDKEEISEVG